MNETTVSSGGGAVLGTVDHHPDVEPPEATCRDLVEGRADEIAEAVRHRFPGHLVRISDRADVTASLLAAGGRAGRHSFTMTRDRTRPAPPVASPPGVALEPLTIDAAAEYATVMRRAYPPDHPDHEPADDDPERARAMVEAYLRGEVVGPFLRDLSWAATDSGRVVGAIVVSEHGTSRTFPGGPWITDVFVDPRAVGRGVGAALVAATIRAAATPEDGSVLGLAVTFGNPARHLYERLGFTVQSETWAVHLPP